MISAINSAFLRLSKRAEANARQSLIETFVDVGPLFTLLSSTDHQILFGRRGTGKTHALSYLASDRERQGDAVVIVDLRNVGSNSGMYGDPSRPLQERATGLIVDALSAIHEGLYQFFVQHSDALDLAQAGPSLDSLAEAITEVKVIGQVELSTKADASHAVSEETKVSAAIRPTSLDASATSSQSATRTHSASESVRRSGEERLYVNFGSTGMAFRRIVDLLQSHRLWVLLDEWSSVPVVLQPYLADLLRRSIFPITGVTVKIAAIEQRSHFQARSDHGDYVGIEVGADASADVSLDDFMVFDNDEERAKAFFRNLVVRHTAAVVHGSDLAGQVPDDGAELVRLAFTEKRAFEEFVRASEGVPRDAINILALAAQRALQDAISVQHVRIAAKNWYQRDKDKAVGANETAYKLLHWVIDRVIGERRARAFLLQSSTNDDLIDALYDARVLHVLKRGVSTHDQPGVRYDVFKLDYGCYVDLISTAKAPLGLLPTDVQSADEMGYVEVPPDDYRSIRRAILSLDRFYETNTG
jgi:hypothetical protein